jgi:hypothetical protein
LFVLRSTKPSLLFLSSDKPSFVTSVRRRAMNLIRLLVLTAVLSAKCCWASHPQPASVAVCVKTGRGRYNVNPRRVATIRRHGGGLIGDPVPGRKREGYIFGDDCRPFIPPPAYDCQTCPGGFYDGCNNCGCVAGNPMPFCTLKFCPPEAELDPPECYPRDYDCDMCPGGFFDGCNTCACMDDNPVPFCTLIACAIDNLEPPRCNAT